MTAVGCSSRTEPSEEGVGEHDGSTARFGDLISTPSARAPLHTSEWGDYPLVGTDGYFSGVEPGVGRQGVYFVTREQNPTTLEKHKTRKFFSTSFEVTDFAAVSGHVFFVVGKDGADDVIEFWTVRPPTGAYLASRPLSTDTPIGDPVVTPPLVVQVVGGVYLEPVPARRHHTVSRRAVYTGQDLGGVRAVAGDPDGRFVLALGQGNPGLYRITTVGGSVEQLLDAATLPFLARANHIHVVRDETLGRGYIIGGAGDINGLTAVIAVDVENDGILDYTELLDEEDYHASPFVNDPTEDFLFY